MSEGSLYLFIFADHCVDSSDHGPQQHGDRSHGAFLAAMGFYSGSFEDRGAKYIRLDNWVPVHRTEDGWPVDTEFKVSSQTGYILTDSIVEAYELNERLVYEKRHNLKDQRDVKGAVIR